MFTAMVLGCIIDPSTNSDFCMGFTSPYIWQTFEECTASLKLGMPYIEEQGWTIKDADCYNWNKKGTKL